MQAGPMRHQVQLQARTMVQDSAGQQQEVWNVFATKRAAVQRTPGAEVYASAQRGGRVPVIFRLRRLDGVLPGMRLIFEGKVHDIISAIPQGQGLKEELLITAEELVEATP